MKKRSAQNSQFTCLVCGEWVRPLQNGSYRNHCPNCLSSLHLDLDLPGDRLSDCKGIMEPIDITYNGQKGYQLIFECTNCRKISKNTVALDDPIQPDNLDKVLFIMSKKMRD